MASLTNDSTIYNAGLPGAGYALGIPPLDNFGALLIGSFVGLAMYGLLLNQVAIYFRLYRKDARVIKCEVVVVVLLETLATVLNIHSCYYYLVINYFDPLRLSESVWSLNLTAGILGASIFTSQSFFIRRVYLLGRSCKSIALLAGLIQLVAIAFDIAATVKAFQVDKFAEIASVTWLITGGSVAITIADAMLTVTLILALRQHRTGFRRTESMIQSITLYTINTGLLNNAISLCFLGFTIAYPTKLFFVAIGILGTRVYANSLLATLNSRHTLVKQGLLTFGVVTTGRADRTTDTGSGQGISRFEVHREMRADIELQSWTLAAEVGASDVAQEAPMVLHITSRANEDTM